MQLVLCHKITIFCKALKQKSITAFSISLRTIVYIQLCTLMGGGGNIWDLWLSCKNARLELKDPDKGPNGSAL